MKKTVTVATLAIYGVTGLTLMADDVKQPYVIQRWGESFEVSKMPAFKESAPISNSFVYFAGEYVEPPYIVSVSNLAVCINGRIAKDFTSDVWIPKPPPKTHPAFPQGINKETSMYYEPVQAYLDDTCDYFLKTRKLGPEQTINEMLLVFQSLPNVKNVEQDAQRPALFHITYNDGTTMSRNILPFTRTPGCKLETVGRYVDSECERWIYALQQEVIIKFIKEGGERESYAVGNGDGEALAYIELARKVKRGDEKAREELINAFKLGESVPDFHPDWIERLANNTKLEARATQILEAKREREKQERERREQ